jgi:putative SOS response-associated peptidase YedK
MCGRFTQFASAEQIAQAFGTQAPEELAPRYNITPETPILIVKEGRRLALAHWGFVPGWAKAWPERRSINARGETIAEKPTFRNAVKHRRCLIPATGFYEWQAQGKGPKQPFFFRPVHTDLFALAGIWEAWHGPEGEEVETAAIITTAANEVVAPIHDRMPVIIAPEDFDAWLDHSREGTQAALALIRPAPPEVLEAVEVSTYINRPGNEGLKCIEPYGV